MILNNGEKTLNTSNNPILDNGVFQVIIIAVARLVVLATANDIVVIVLIFSVFSRPRYCDRTYLTLSERCPVLEQRV